MEVRQKDADGVKTKSIIGRAYVSCSGIPRAVSHVYDKRYLEKIGVTRATSTHPERDEISTRMLSKAAKTPFRSMPTPMTTRYRFMGPCQLPSLSKESLRLPLMLNTDLR